MSPIMKLIELYMSFWYWVHPLDEILVYIRVNWFQRLAAAKKVHWWLWGFNLIWWINLFPIIGLQFNWGYIWPLNDCGFMASYRRVGSLEPLFLWPLNDWELHNVEDFFFFSRLQGVAADMAGDGGRQGGVDAGESISFPMCVIWNSWVPYVVSFFRERSWP